MKIKVCGINDAVFAAEASRLGVDYLGFIFEPSSPRCVTLEKAEEIVSSLDASLRRRVRLVGVFVRETPAEIIATMRRVGLDVVQLHRRATGEDVAALKAAGYEVWTLAGGAEGDGVLFDSSHGDGDTAFRTGGFKSILAGRIGVENVANALALKPDIIDVNSSIETQPGVKSTILLAAFLAEFVKHLKSDA
ncbi:MAG: phosphoribosylanthranilate isomerase [Kiritimatiellae bacterium]|nr:phosphoribosylanthranilate isomerase [Kiritimatiellia bacterium]